MSRVVRGRPQLTEEQQALADDLRLRALTIRASSDGELSITEAVQLGLEAPQTGQEEG